MLDTRPNAGQSEYSKQLMDKMQLLRSRLVKLVNGTYNKTYCQIVRACPAARMYHFL